MKTSLIKTLPLTEPHTCGIPTVHFGARSHVGVCLCASLLRVPAVLINYFLLVNSTGDQIQWAKSIDPQFAFASRVGCSHSWPDCGLQTSPDQLINRSLTFSPNVHTTAWWTATLLVHSCTLLLECLHPQEAHQSLNLSPHFPHYYFMWLVRNERYYVDSVMV